MKLTQGPAAPLICADKVLVLYLKRPQRDWEVERMCKGALQIPRLEEAAPWTWDLYLG